MDQERQRIIDMSQSEIKEKNLVLDRITKYYGKFLAVNQVSLCVKPYVYFGLQNGFHFLILNFLVLNALAFWVLMVPVKPPLLKC